MTSRDGDVEAPRRLFPHFSPPPPLPLPPPSCDAECDRHPDLGELKKKISAAAAEDSRKTLASSGDVEAFG